MRIHERTRLYAVAAFVICVSNGVQASSIVLDPAKGQTLEAWARHPDPAVTDILLKAGHHGRPVLQGMKDVVIHSDGHAAILDRTKVVYSPRITFRSIKWRGLKDKSVDWSNSLFYADDTAPDLRVENCIFSSTDDTSRWNAVEWQSLPYGQLIYSRSPRAVFSQNTMFNAYNVMSIDNNGWSVLRNSMHDFVNDGIDFRGSQVTIADNRIFDSRDLPSNPMHADGIQGMAAYGNVPQPYTNVRITGNFVDAGTKSNSPMQGISAFDGKWKDVILSENYVRPRSYHGITWMGVENITVENNTVDQFRNERGVPLEHYPDLPKPWIMVNSAKDHSPSTGVKIGTNTTPQYAGDSIAELRPRPERLPIR